ncbi:hypothetical protein MRX96_043086 [Rhipicephalus microplus]
MQVITCHLIGEYSTTDYQGQALWLRMPFVFLPIVSDFYTLLDAEPHRVATFVSAACALHNFLGLDAGAGTKEQSFESVLRDTFFPIQPVRGSRFKRAASAVRDGLCDYLNGEEAVPCQDDNALADPTKHR